MGQPGILFVIFLALLAGFVVTAGVRSSFPARAAFSYAAGMGLISLQMFFYSLLSVKYSLVSIALPWFMVALIIGVLRPGWFKAEPFEARPRERFKPVEWFFIAIISFQAVFSLVNSVMLPIKGYDTWVIWFMKGKAFYMDGGVTADFFLKGVYSNGNLSYRYPLSMPLVVTLGYLGMGHVDDQTVKLLFSAYFVSLLVILYHFGRGVVSRPSSLLLLAVFALIPRIAAQAGLDGVGYADLPLSVYFMAGAGFAVRYIDRGRAGEFLLSIFFMSLGAWVKNEGITFLAIGFILLACLALYRHGQRAYAPVAIGLVLVIIVALPWQVYKLFLPELSSTMVSDLSISSISANATRLPKIFKTILPRLFTADKYNVAWALYLLGLSVSWRRWKEPGFAYLQAMIFFQMSCYVFVYMITTMDLVPQIATSFDRLTIHLLPIVFLSVACGWRDFFEGGGMG